MLNSKDSFREMQKSCDEDAVAKDRATGQALIRRDSAHEKSEGSKMLAAASETIERKGKPRRKALVYMLTSATLIISGTVALIAGGASGVLPTAAGLLAMSAGTLAAGAGLGIGMGFLIVSTGKRIEKAKGR